MRMPGVVDKPSINAFFTLYWVVLNKYDQSFGHYTKPPFLFAGECYSSQAYGKQHSRNNCSADLAKCPLLASDFLVLVSLPPEMSWELRFAFRPW